MIKFVKSLNKDKTIVSVQSNGIYWFRITLNKERDKYLCIIDEPRTGFGKDEIEMNKFIPAQKMDKYISNEWKEREIQESKFMSFIYNMNEHFPKLSIGINPSKDFEEKFKVFKAAKGNIDKYEKYMKLRELS